MKVRLYNRDGYRGMEDVKFPVDVEAELAVKGEYYAIRGEELVRVGADKAILHSPVPFLFYKTFVKEIIRC